MSEVETAVGDTKDVLVRAEASMTEYFYNKTEYAFADTWVVRPEVRVQFLGEEPFVFKPGMTFQGAIVVSKKYHKMKPPQRGGHKLPIKKIILWGGGDRQNSIHST